ncbi:MAG: hypothetical protein ACXVB9_16450 [Bdellovibrionota bacterium]
MRKFLTFLSLFTSLSTLLCCALPALFVAIGMGAAFAGLIGAVPQIVWVSENKGVVFGLGALLLAVGGLLQWRAKYEPCPLNSEQAAACLSARRSSRILYFVSLVIYAVGAFFAFAGPYL